MYSSDGHDVAVLQIWNICTIVKTILKLSQNDLLYNNAMTVLLNLYLIMVEYKFYVYHT